MGRPLRWTTTTSEIMHVMNRGVERRSIFMTDADRVEFGNRLRELHERFGVRTLGYCLMTNHFHLLLHVPGRDVSTPMHHLGSRFARYFNDVHGRDGPLFRSRFHAISVTTEAYLLCALRYIHRNALDLPGVARYDRYRWSSARTYLGLRPCPSYVDTEPILGLFPDREAFAAFHDEASRFHSAGPLGEAPSFDEVVALSLADDDLHHGSADESTSRLTRTLSALVASSDLGWAAGQLARRQDQRDPSLQRLAQRRAQRRLEDPVVARHYRRLVELIAS